MMYDLIIIGAGASGLMSACRVMADNPDLKTAVVEKNAAPGRKLYATGNGRCNFVNAECEAGDFYTGKEYEWEELFVNIDPQSVIDAFYDLGIIADEEEDGRMYPRCREAAAVVRALERGAAGCDIFCVFEVKSVSKEKGFFTVFSSAGDKLSAKAVLLASGGKAGIQFGSDGRGYKLAESFGHSIVKPIPALTALIPDKDISSLAGVRAGVFLNLIKEKNGKAKLLAFNEYGELQFTKNAISGICAMNLSRYIRKEAGASYKLVCDFVWDYQREELLELFSYRPEFLYSMLPEKLASYIEELSHNDPAEIAALCKGLSFNITGTKGWPDAQVTAGGIDLDEVNLETMESKLVSGLYFTGEILDIDGPCGGYNLTWAFQSAITFADSFCGSL